MPLPDSVEADDDRRRIRGPPAVEHGSAPRPGRLTQRRPTPPRTRGPPRGRLAAVETRRLGSTGLDVPVIGLGTWQTYDVGDATQVRPVTEAALADDATFFDTSPIRASR